jgi:hypothetical protein
VFGRELALSNEPARQPYVLRGGSETVYVGWERQMSY